MLNSKFIDPANVRDLRPMVLDTNGGPKIMPASFYQGTTVAERAVFGARTALYSLPTHELVEFVRKEIGGRPALEIGAGHGCFARALGIPATDSWMQQSPEVAAHYALIGQKTIEYGSDVEKLSAEEAVAKYRPKVVVGCWVTHLYREDRADAGGNMFGIDEEALIDACETYIFVGNNEVHKHKSIWARPHSKIEPDWVFSRAMNGSPDFVAIWNNPSA